VWNVPQKSRFFSSATAVWECKGGSQVVVTFQCLTQSWDSPKGHGSHPVHSPSILEQMHYAVHCDETNTLGKKLVMQVSVMERGDTLYSRENHGLHMNLSFSPGIAPVKD